jgi:exonuclease SbcD
VLGELESLLTKQVENYLSEADPNLPVVLLAHASVQGAIYGGERSVMLGSDVVLAGSLVKDKRFDYVALGHIHKSQDVNKGERPPVIYPGSIERVDFGEAQDDKFFVIVELEKGNTSFQWRKLEKVRPFFDSWVRLESQEKVMQTLLAKLPAKAQLKDAIVRLTIDYPRELEPHIDEASLREAAADTFEFHLVKRPQMEARVRIPEGQHVGELSSADLLNIYWRSAHVDENEQGRLLQLAQTIIEDNPVKD